MVEIIGVATIVALSWLLTISLANECDAEKRRRAALGIQPGTGEDLTTAAKHAA
ncbi:MAG TPA: hypothetical protein VJ692_11035 [Nitrospiraceae bacterium]|nr:hypothetical protein [Nitrospiraceae bacterium]